MSLELQSNGHQNNLKEVKPRDSNVYEFEGFVLDASHLMLCRRGGEEISMTPKQVETLLALVERNGEIVAIDVLMDRLWPNAFVEESNLIQNIHILRKTLGETSGGKPMIETLRRRGYRFNGEITINPKHAPTHRDQAKEAPALLKFPTVVPDLVLAEKESVRGIPLKNKGLASIAAVLFLAASLSVGYYFYSSRTVAVGESRSFAVLPLKPINSASRDEIYENGIADSLIHKLSSLKGFVIRPLSATRKYADIEQDAITAGKEQQVDYVLASNYQLADGRIKITSQLINVGSGQIEDTYSFEKEALSVFAIQGAVAAEFGKKLLSRFGGTSTDPGPRRGTANEEAYRLYIQGLALAEKRKPDIPKAIDYFEQAVRLDPGYALAYAKLAGAHSALANRGDNNRDDEYLKARAAIEKAFAIDANLSEAHTSFGDVLSNHDWDFAGAEREYKLAVELDPNSSNAHAKYALLLVLFGRLDESIAEMKTAIDLEPASVDNHHAYAWILYQARRYDEAITEEKRVIEIDPEDRMDYNVLTNSYRLIGDNDRSFEAFLQRSILDGDKPDEINSLRAVFARSGWRGIAERGLKQMKADEKKGPVNYSWMASYSIELEQNDEAFAYLEKAVDQRRPAMRTLKVNPRYDPLRSDPRFDELVRRVGLK